MNVEALTILVVMLALVVGLVVRIRTKRAFAAWLASCTIVPAYVLFAEFVLPYQGGGASMWPIALLVGGLYGAVAGAVGVGAGSLIARRRERSL